MKYRNLKRKCGVYLITNLSNGRIYIGYASDLFGRIQTHFEGIQKLDSNRTRPQIVEDCKSNNYGIEDFSITPIFMMNYSEENCRKMERYEQKAIDDAWQKGLKLYNRT